MATIDKAVVIVDSNGDPVDFSTVLSDDEKVKVSSNDTTSGYLEDKITVSDGSNTSNIIEKTTQNDGANENVRLRIDETKIDHTNIQNVGTNTHAQIDTDIAAAIHDNVSGEIAAITEKTELVGADILLIEDSASSNAKKRAELNTLLAPISVQVGMVAYWKCDEAAGATTLYDDTAYGADGAITNATMLPSGGHIDGCISFDGAGDWVAVTTATTDPLNELDYITVTAWFKCDEDAANGTSVIRHDGHFTALQVAGDGATALVAYWTDGFHSQSYTWSYDDSTWHHLAVTYSRTGGVAVYIDGSLVVSDAVDIGRLTATANNFMLGATEGGGENYEGELDDVRVYNRVLNTAEIEYLAGM